jgi:cytochrome c peroxidase
MLQQQAAVDMAGGHSYRSRVTLSSRKNFGLLLAAAAGLSMAIAEALAQPPAYRFDLPRGFPAPRVPRDNPMSEEKVALGRFLFYDTRLSGNQTQSCASCHRQERAFTDGRVKGVGSTGEVHPRNSMSLTNVAYTATLAWANPLLTTLENQALIPMFGERPVELGLAGREEELLDRLQDDARYRRMFREAFSSETEPISIAGITRAIASFQRTLISGNSPFDRYQFGDDDALSLSALRGMDLFFSERLECFHCHGGFLFSNSVVHAGTVFVEAPFHNNALYNIDGKGAYPPDNTGIMEITGDPRDMGRFKSPTLRNIELTAPYMHDGSITTLEEVLVDHYGAGGRTIEEGPLAGVGSESPLKDGFIIGFRLSEQEKNDVLEFLRSLTDHEFVTNPRFSDPFLAPACPGDCNHDGEVTIDELLAAVGMALEQNTLAACVSADANGDGEVGVDELVRMIRLAAEGCVSP